MFQWIPYAMVRIAAFFIAGILLGIYNQQLLEPEFAQILLCGLVLAYLIYCLIARNQMKRTPLPGVIGLLAVFMAGYVHLSLYVEWNKTNHLSKVEPQLIHAYVAEVRELPEEKEKSWKYTLRVLQVHDGESWTTVSAKTLLYIKKEAQQPVYFYGDKILIQGSPELLSPPQNPHEFDFKRFLTFKNIYHQQFVRTDQVQFVSSIQNKDFKYYSLLARQWAGSQLKKQLRNPKEQAIAMALTLGITDGIDNDLQNAYAASGAMHVLAVSGLHVGIIYGIVLLLFKPFQNLSWSRWVIAILSLLALWSFAFITGLSPSVLRAVTMFSFIAIAKPFGRSTSIYNTLAASAFLLLLFNPYLIMSVGFQLSYLAVLGIVTIHRPLYQLLEPKNAILDWVWNISCVSIAAQLATFSLGVLYFHQFPVYFLFSNLFVIPGAISVLVTSITLIALSPFEPLAYIVGIILQKLIQLLNFGVFTFEKFPYSLINNIYIDTFQCWLLMLAICMILMLVRTKQFKFMVAATALVVVFSITQWQHQFIQTKNGQLVVYKIPGHQAIEWISDGTSTFYADSAIAHDEEKIRFHVRPNRLFLGARNTVTGKTIDHKISVFSKNGKLIGIINEPLKSWPQNLKLDYLIIGNNSFKSLADIRNTIIFDKLILDSSNSPYVAARIGREGGESVFDVMQKGAFIEIF